MGDQIMANLDYLCRNITNLTEILMYLIKHDIISQNESDEVKAEKTPLEQNYKLLSTIQKKDRDGVRNLFLEILRKTNNQHCANEIEGVPNSPQARNILTHYELRKWWPEEKILIKSLHERKFGSRLLVEELHDRILKDENRMTVICESVDAAKLTRMGGVGKTLTAKWYAHHYQHEYDHILWIDCGEDSLLKSFKKLASDLDVTKRNEFQEVGEFARKCFEVLSDFQCLWIYDNAESYQGEEGIFKVLPKNQAKFFCLITSRSAEWGVKNIGFGRISDLQLEIFAEEESLQFFEDNLDEKVIRNENELKELCGLMGNLPLALQLAAAALNSGKIDLQNYLEKTTAEDTAEIVDAKFDDYEKTINKNIKISLDLILEDQKNGKLALNILMAFGYIRPDNVQSKLFMKMFKLNVDVVREAVDILEKYSLVARTGSISEFPYDDGVVNKMFGWDKIKAEMDLLSIHRLLQQVIRHNGKETEKKTLKKILGCEGFTEYKFISFTKYADEDLKKQFPKVKAELLDQEQLRKLLKDRRFEDAVELAKFIDQELKTKTTRLNYAICLQKNGQLEESLTIVEPIFVKRTVNHQLATCVDELFTCSHKMTVQTDLEYDYPRLVELAIKEASELDIGTVLLYSHLRMGNYEQALTTARQIVTEIGQLIQLVSITQVPYYHLQTLEYGKLVYLQMDVETKKVELRGFSLSLDSFHRLSPEELTLDRVSFFRDGQELKQVKVNDFVDLSNIKQLTIECLQKKKNVSVDLGGDASMEYLHLNDVQVLNWDISNWNVKQLHLRNILFVKKTNIRVQQFTIWYSSCDVSCLPETIQKLTLTGRVEVFVSGDVKLPTLNYLTLWSMDVGCLAHFRLAPLTHIHLHLIKEVNVDLLPQTLTQLKITNYNEDIRVVGGVKKVDKLILEDLSFERVEEYLSHLQTDNLVIYNYQGIEAKQLVQLMEKKVNTITVGKINWGNEEFKNYSNQLDRQAECYFLQGGRGRAMEKEEFKISKIFGM